MNRLWALVGLVAASVQAQAPAEEAPAEEAAEERMSVQRALRAYRHEPTVAQLVRAVRELDDYDLGVPRRALRRSRRGGWLPTVRVAARRGQQYDLSAQIEDESTRVSTDDDLTLEASLTFRFDRAAYGPDEVAWARETRARERAREERIQTLIAAYFERRRLQLERDLRGRDDLEVALRIAELEALIDALSGGAFTRMMRDP